MIFEIKSQNIKKLQSLMETIYAMRILLTFLVIFVVVKCYPLSKQNADKRETRIEKGYPNGTVIGKYEYTDKEGNPIEVKYYADDSRYGVELNSVKIIHGDVDLPSVETKQLKVENEIKSSDPTFGVNEYIEPKYSVSKKYNSYVPNKETTKANDAKSQHQNADYEIYLPNVFKSSKACSKEKVRVYNFDKPKRTIRNALDDEMPKFCQQF